MPEARRTAEVHRGSFEHDQKGGFAADRELAQKAGRRGGEEVLRRYGPQHYSEIGKKGSDAVKRKYGSQFYREIGRLGGEARAKRIREEKAKRQVAHR